MKKKTINTKYKDDKWFQYALNKHLHLHNAKVASNYGEIKWNSERTLNIKRFINKYNWHKINYPSKINDWKTFGKNKSTTALNVLYAKEMEICPAYISNYNSNCEKQITLILISNEKGWHYLAVGKLSALLKGITSKYNRDF